MCSTRNDNVRNPSQVTMANCVLDESDGSKCPSAQEEVVLGRSKSYVSLAITFTYHNVQLWKQLSGKALRQQVTKKVC